VTRPSRRGPFQRRSISVATSLAIGGLIALAAPAAVFAHQLTGRFASPIPLGAYLVGAALAVGASFTIVFLRDAHPRPPASTIEARTVRLASGIRTGLLAIGVIAWLWVVVGSAILGGHSDGDPASLFLWTYGWVGLAIASALIGPVWAWLDPFATLHRLAAGLVRRLGIDAGSSAAYPERLGAWPAVIGFAVFVWLELAVQARSGRGLGLVLVAYTVVTLVGMAQFGRDTWRRHGEVFSVWFGLVGRLAPLAPPEAGRANRVRVGPFASGLLDARSDLPELALVATSIGAILFDGLSQTQVYFDLFGIPTVPVQTLLLFGWLGLVVGLAVGVSRLVGVGPLVAGLIPIAIGYLIAHYLTFLLFDGQRIVIALNDPLGLGWNLFGASQFEPATGWLPGAVVWTVQLVVVVGGHIIGAWAGHTVAVQESIGRELGGPLADPSPAAVSGAERAVRWRQLPLALLMVGLTALTLWSLGQAIVQTADAVRLTGG